MSTLTAGPASTSEDFDFLTVEPVTPARVLRSEWIKAMEEATHQLAEARRLADDAKEAAREAAEEAQRQAEELAAEAQEHAKGAERQVAAAESIRKQSQAAAKQTARQLKNGKTNGDLASHNKEELLDLAATIDVPGRSKMNKDQLVKAIEKASKSRAA